MARSSDDNVFMDKWLEQVGKAIADGSLQIVKECQKPASKDLSKSDIYASLASTMLMFYIEGIVYETLTSYLEDDIKDREEAAEVASQRFQVLKTGVQEAVAAGFERAFATFSNKKLDYYCLINPTPPPVNVEPC